MATDSQTRIVTSLQRHFLVITVVLIVLLLLAQFVVLATLGTKGAEIAGIRMEKDQLRIQNEYIRSEIDKSRTLAQIENGLDDLFDLTRADVEVIHNFDSGEQESLSSAQLNP